MMKKIIFIYVVAIAVLFSTIVSAKTDNVIGNIYSTDILAYINDIPVQSYNIGGKTAIIIEDIASSGYQPLPSGVINGIWCTYNDELRTLLVSMNSFWVPEQIVPIERGKVGKIVGKIYDTDIITYINGLPIQAFALNGKMAVAIEDLCIEPDDFGYSPYNMRCVWNADERTISLYYLYNNGNEISEYMQGKPLSIRLENDVVDIVIDYFHPSGYGGSTDGNFNPPPRYPVYCDGKEVALGFSQPFNIYFYISDDGTAKLVKEERYHSFDRFYNIAAMKEIIDAIVVPPPTYEQVLKYYTVDMWGDVIDRIDTDDCTFLYISQGNPHGASQFLVRIAKNGEYHDYSRDFESVSLWGNKHFDNVKLENDKVSFRYDTDYIIDLKSGGMYKK